MYRNPPLSFGGVTAMRGEPGDARTIAWGLTNRGRFPVRVREVQIDWDPEAAAKPIWVVGAMSYTGHLVTGSVQDNPYDENSYILVPVADLVVPPERESRRTDSSPYSRTFSSAESYGLIARYSFDGSGISSLGRVTIRYTYLGLPLTAQRHFEVDE